MSNKIRVRFAPSPTGYLHVGGARTALYDYLYAKKLNGTFVLRIEDTDLERSTEESLKKQVEDLMWLGLKWDEGLDPFTFKDMGPHAPYRQSHRKEIYKQHAEQLIKSGKAFYCFMSDEEMDVLREKAIAEGKPGQILSPYRDLSISDALKKIQAGEKAVVRFRIPKEEKVYKIKDLVRGDVEFPTTMVGDFVLIRSDGMPVYNFCCVVDDSLMKISHVFRAEEHLSNTLRQLLLYEAFEFSVPEFGHTSIILGSDKQKLSKRHGATSVGQYKELGYLPEAINNFLALLGWSSPSGSEVMDLEQIIKEFDTDRLNSSPAVFDETKLKWMNSVHLRNLPSEDLWNRLQPFLKNDGVNLDGTTEWRNRVLEVFKSYMETLKESVNLFKPLDSSLFKIEEESKEVLSWPTSKDVINSWRTQVQAMNSEYMTETDFLNAQNEVMKTCNVKGKNLFMPIRVAVIGKPQGVELKMVVPLLSKMDLLSRADKTISKIGI